MPEKPALLWSACILSSEVEPCRRGAEIRSVRLFQRLTHRRRQGLGVNGLIVVEAAAEAKRHTDQQRACDELTA